LRITSQSELRTLRPSTRSSLAREQERRRLICPWVLDPAYRPGRTYPRASLLGLPTELRQQILSESLGCEELEEFIKALEAVKE
ncbi:hypothetical protein EJ02DRAFT_304741, partial [Clathrospora elynae]